MRQIFFIAFIFYSAMGASLFSACGSDFGANKQHSTPALDSLLADTALMGDEALIAPANQPKDTSMVNTTPAKITMASDLDYSPIFLKKLTYAGLAKTIELTDSLIILEQKDTFAFPQLLPLDPMGKAKWTNFVASKGGYLYSLDVSRSNFTTIDFNFELRKGRQTIDQLTGKADLDPGFLLGSESDDDPITGSSYFATEYHFEGPDCTFSIRLGDDEGMKKVKLIKQCKSGKFDIALDNCPVLLEK